MKIKYKFLIALLLIALLLPAGVFAEVLQDSNNDPCTKFLSFRVKSFGFSSGTTIPVKFVCEKIPGGKNISIPLVWSGEPTVTKSFAVLMYDLNPVANNFVHWAVINIPSNVYEIREGASGTVQMPAGSIELINSSGKAGYIGPCPPPGTGKHEYKIIVYALKTKTLDLSGPVTLSQFQEAIKNNTYTQSEITGYFEHKNR